MRQTTGLTVHSGTRADAFADTGRDTIVFVGSKRSFSGPALRTVASEIRDLDALQCDSLEECAREITKTGANVRCLVVDARICQANDTAFLQGLAGVARQFEPHGLPGLALAFWDQDCAAVPLFAQMLDGGSPHWPGPVQGFLPMAQPLDIWLAVIRLLISGGSYVPAELMTHPVAAPPPAAKPEPAAKPARVMVPERVLETLTDRETEVLSLVASGLQNKQVAGMLDLSEHTIKLHMHHIIAKLEVKNRTEAAMRYISATGKKP